jgi:hypothetical protein
LIDGTLKIVTDGGGVVTFEVPTATVGNDYGIHFFYPAFTKAGNVVQSTADGFALTDQPVIALSDDAAEKTINGPINIHANELVNPETYIAQFSHGESQNPVDATDDKLHIKADGIGFRIDYTNSLKLSGYGAAGKPTWAPDGSEFVTDSVFPLSIANGGTGETTKAETQKALNISYVKTANVSSNTALVADDSGTTYRAGTASNNVFFTLPLFSTVDDGFTATFVKGAVANLMIVRANPSDSGIFIDGQTSHSFSQIYDAITVVKLGGRGFITSRVDGTLFD